MRNRRVGSILGGGLVAILTVGSVAAFVPIDFSSVAHVITEQGDPEEPPAPETPGRPDLNRTVSGEVTVKLSGLDPITVTFDSDSAGDYREELRAALDEAIDEALVAGKISADEADRLREIADGIELGETSLLPFGLYPFERFWERDGFGDGFGGDSFDGDWFVPGWFEEFPIPHPLAPNPFERFWERDGFGDGFDGDSFDGDWFVRGWFEEFSIPHPIAPTSSGWLNYY